MTITLARVRGIMPSILDEYGEEYIYDNIYCIYKPQGHCPACLVGTILTKLGEHRQDIDAAGETVTWSTDSVGRGFIGDVSSLWIAYPDMFAADGVVDYLLVMQQIQDERNTWGHAYAEAEAWYARRIKTTV